MPNDFSKKDLKELKKLYKSYHKHVKIALKEGIDAQYISNCCQSDLKDLTIDTLQKLDIDYTLAQIKENFERTGLIILRDPYAQTSLLLGCGNNPQTAAFSKDHSHEVYITINPQLSMNPTIVGAVS